MADSTMELLRELTEAPGISGYEQEVREVIRKHLQDMTTIEQDRLGSIVCRKNGKAEKPRIMLAGHMDDATQDIYTHLGIGGIKDQIIEIIDKF